MSDQPKRETSAILTVNGGSSSLKFAVFGHEIPLRRTLSGKIERIGQADGSMTVKNEVEGSRRVEKVSASDPGEAAKRLIGHLQDRGMFSSIEAVGHRVVHGGEQHISPERVTSELISDLKAISPIDPDHLPGEIALIEAFEGIEPRFPQFVCFDTAFHREMPRVATLLPIPRKYESKGLRRFGFHGLSYEYLLEKLRDEGQAHGRVILAHLGAGASLAAVKDGRSIDTSMGFTPTAGLMMATRTGDLDPGVGDYLARTEGLTSARYHAMVNKESGLLGISETSADVRDLLESEASDSRAAEALDLFCYQVKKWIGAYAAALGGLDTLVFSGGIGENAPAIRLRICSNLEFLGIALDHGRNKENAPTISAPDLSVSVRVISTDEEQTIARAVVRLLAASHS